MKKILLAVGAVIVVLAAVFVFLSSRPPKSPPGTATFSQGNIDAKVTYHRPYKKGRLIFGEKSAGALVPFGEYWRLGANASTAITFGKNVTFAGKPVNAGTYRMYAVPSATTWKVTLNSEPSRFGIRQPDHDKDVATAEVPVETTPDKLEQLTIGFVPDGANAKLEISWDGTVVHVPLAAN